MDPARVTVVGSVNMDVRVRTPHLPQPGETVLGTDFATGPGGKGANQAVAAARAGAIVSFVGAVGTDAFGDSLREHLVHAGVSGDTIRTAPGPSGVAVITVDTDGQNSIVVAPGANHSLVALTDSERDAIARADILLCQLEIPIPTVLEAARVARAHGTVVMLNPSPVAALPRELLDLVDVAVVNETEAAALAHPLADTPAVVTTRGGRGAHVRLRDGTGRTVRPPQVDVVDTTGAGDAFAGALAATWQRRPDTLEFACAAGALATTALGASTAPDAAAVDAALAAATRD
ncbi:ribokinase [Rhodococcus sp. HNM0569]|uniref:PfkB family carbohydrate kinase n=1 Tax=Rhodococcus sp. HNM0569 TaxID=2716340 RepID=UPI00146B0443|nr:ribokinase [Rhodococcus sp. HNM0569]